MMTYQGTGFNHRGCTPLRKLAAIHNAALTPPHPSKVRLDRDWPEDLYAKAMGVPDQTEMRLMPPVPENQQASIEKQKSTRAKMKAALKVKRLGFLTEEWQSTKELCDKCGIGITACGQYYRELAKGGECDFIPKGMNGAVTSMFRLPTGMPYQELKAVGRKADVLAALHPEDWQTTREVATRAKFNTEHARDVLAALLDQGKVEQWQQHRNRFYWRAKT